MSKEMSFVFFSNVEATLCESLDAKDSAILGDGGMQEVKERLVELAAKMLTQGTAAFTKSEIAFLLLFAAEVVEDTMASEKVAKTANEELAALSSPKPGLN